jgi:hypothetical protein
MSIACWRFEWPQKLPNERFKIEANHKLRKCWRSVLICPARVGKERPFPSDGSFSAPKTVLMQGKILLYGAAAILVKCFEVSPLNQGIRLPIDPQAEYLEDFHCDGILRNRSFLFPRMLAQQQSSESGAELCQCKNGYRNRRTRAQSQPWEARKSVSETPLFDQDQRISREDCGGLR